MKRISVSDMKAQWSEIERQVKAGKTFEVLNRGKPSVLIVPATPRKVFTWNNHLETAIKLPGKSASETVNEDRGGRW